MFKVLLVEDSMDCQILVKKTLGHHDLIIVESAEEVLPILNQKKIDLILLDITLPLRDGYSLLSELQATPQYSSIPVICLTGRSAITDKVTAFSLGADDYIQKPFEPLELKARVDSKLLKHCRLNIAHEKIHCGNLRIDLVTQSVTDIQNKEIILTQTEYKLLCSFAKYPNQVFSREKLLTLVWGNSGEVYDRVVDVHICSLRKKVAAYGLGFKSVSGVGYRMTTQTVQTNLISA